MNRRWSAARIVWAVAGVAAAGFLAVRGLLDFRAGTGGVLLLVAAVVLAGVLLRLFVYRD